MTDERDKRVIRSIQGDIPLRKRPFVQLAEEAGMDEDEFITRVRGLEGRGILRRFGATLRHQQAGFRSNAMVAWMVPDHSVDQAGEKLAGYREVTHCYERPAKGDWPYNLYSMIHADSRQECLSIARRMSEAIGIHTYEVLFSEEEFKKTSMQYF